MRGNFKLNDVWYKAHNNSLPDQQVANQAASKVGQGNSEYADMTTWSAWIQENWQEGVGRLRPHRNGGFLYGEVESRVPEQLILAVRPDQVDVRTTGGSTGDCRNFPPNMQGVVTITSAQKAAMQITTPSGAIGDTLAVWFYCQGVQGEVLTLQIRTNNSGDPSSTVVTSGTVTIQEDTKGFAWHGAVLDTSGAKALSTSTAYWVCIVPTTSVSIAYNTGGYNVAAEIETSGTWTTETGKYLFFSTNAQKLGGGTADNTGTGFFRFTNTTQSDLYCYVGARVFKYSEANDRWTAVGNTNNANVSSVATYASEVWFGNATTFGVGNAYKMAQDETFSDSGFSYDVFARHGGLLWASSINLPSYSDDGITFINYDDMYCGTDEYPITGMAGMGDSMYVSTAEGLYRIAPGDFAVPVAPWGSQDPDNGRAMVNFQGNLYVAADNRIYRFSQDLQRQDVWLTREDDLITGRIGKVQSLAVSNSWLLAYVADGIAGGKPTIWAMQGSSWHHIATLPDSPLDADGVLVNYSMFYDAVTGYLWVLTPQRVTYKIYLPSTMINPYNDPATDYMPRGWVEWDWFDSNIIEAQKDYESVTIIGENFSSTRTATVYWKDDASTAWELLGTVDSNNEELIWTSSATRPNTKRFKLGILLATNNGSLTPRVRAIRVKYSLNIRDWFRWSIIVDVSGRTGHLQTMLDGERNTLTASQIKANIDALVRQPEPFVYQDVDGQEYDVRAVDANFRYTKQEYIDATTTGYWEGAYRMVLEQVRPGANA